MRVNFIFKNEDLYAECIKDYEGFSLIGEKFGPFERGKKYKLKLFEALPFIENNILTVAPNAKCDNIDVQRYAINERDESRLIPEKDFFLNKLKEFKRFMEKDVKDGTKPRNFLDNYNSYLSDIIDSRLLKLLKLSKSELSLDDERRLTDPEKLLWNHFNHLIKTWKNFFFNI